MEEEEQHGAIIIRQVDVNDDDDDQQDQQDPRRRQRVVVDINLEELCRQLRNNEVEDTGTVYRFDDTINNNDDNHDRQMLSLLMEALLYNQQNYNNDDKNSTNKLRSLNLSRAFDLGTGNNDNQHINNDNDQSTTSSSSFELFHFFVTQILMGHPSSIENLHLRSNGLTNEHASLLSGAIQQHTSLVVLNLSCNTIGDDGIISLVMGLNSNCIKTLKGLWLANNEIGFEGCRALASLLSVSQLHDLDLGWNRIGPEGCEALAEALKSKNCLLRRLFLRNNRIGSTGARSLSTALGNENCTLRRLYLTSNGIGDYGAEALFESIKHNKLLEGLRLELNADLGISPTSVVYLASMIRRNTALQVLVMPREFWERRGTATTRRSTEDNNVGKELVEDALVESNYTLRFLPSATNTWVRTTVRDICNHNRRIKQNYDRLFNNNNNSSSSAATIPIPISLWPDAIVRTGINTKAGLIYSILRDRIDEWT